MRLIEYWMKKTATPRWLKEFGRLSAKAQKKITRKVSRPPEQIISGMERGFDNKVRKLGAKVVPSEGLNGYSANQAKNTIYIPENEESLLSYLKKSLSRFSKGPIFGERASFFGPLGFKNVLRRKLGKYNALADAAVSKNHEADELFFGKRSKNPFPGANLFLKRKKSNVEIGRHSSLGVLGNESNNSLRLRASGVVPSDQHVRDNYSSESSLLKGITGKNYGYDFFDKKDISNLHRKSVGKIIYDRSGKIHSSVQNPAMPWASVKRPVPSAQNSVSPLLPFKSPPVSGSPLLPFKSPPVSGSPLLPFKSPPVSGSPLLPFKSPPV